MRNKWILSLAILACVSIGLFSGCGYSQEYVEREVALAEDVAYELGYETGYEEGENWGYTRGQDKAYESGFQDGYSRGHREGLIDGWEIAQVPEAFEQTSDIFVDILSVTSPVSRGNFATLEAQTIPDAHCGIEVYYKTGKSEAIGLYSHRSDDEGCISWRWLVGGNTTPGIWEIVVTAYDLENLSAQMPIAQDITYFQVQ